MTASKQTPTTKIFRAANVTAALEEVQRDFGPEAIVISVRQAPAGPAWQAWRNPGVEVIAVPPASAGAKDRQPIPDTRQTEKSMLAVESVRQPAVRAHAPETGKTSGQDRPGLPHAGKPAFQDSLTYHGEGKRELRVNLPPLLVTMQEGLRAQGVDENLVDRIVKASLGTLSPASLGSKARLRDFLGQQLMTCLPARSSTTQAAGRIICLTGSRGSGKTSLCAKLAARYSAQPDGGPRHRVVWICADTVSAGAISEAGIYTGALGLQLHVVYTPGELAQIVAAEQANDEPDIQKLILVDLPGCNPHKETGVIEVGDFLTVLPRRTTYLVAPATAKESDLDQALSIFAPFKLNGLAVTHLDETLTYGNIFNLAWRRQIPLVYFSSGPRVPDDLQPANTRLLIEALFEGHWRG